MNIESTFIQTFASPERRDRYLALLSPKRRTDFLCTLYHSFDFDLRFATQIATSDQTAENIKVILKNYGASAFCHVISNDPTIDTQKLPIDMAIERTVGFNMGTVLIFDPLHLAYYESEDIRGRFIFRR